MSVTSISSLQQSVSQTGSTQPSTGSRILKGAAIGGVLGAAAGAGLSFTALPFIGVLTAPIAAAIGGAAGILVGGLVGFLCGRSGSDDAKGGAVGPQSPPPVPSGSGVTRLLPPPLPA